MAVLKISAWKWKTKKRYRRQHSEGSNSVTWCSGLFLLNFFLCPEHLGCGFMGTSVFALGTYHLGDVTCIPDWKTSRGTYPYNVQNEFVKMLILLREDFPHDSFSFIFVFSILFLKFGRFISIMLLLLLLLLFLFFFLVNIVSGTGRLTCFLKWSRNKTKDLRSVPLCKREKERAREKGRKKTGNLYIYIWIESRSCRKSQNNSDGSVFFFILFIWRHFPDRNRTGCEFTCGQKQNGTLECQGHSTTGSRRKDEYLEKHREVDFQARGKRKETTTEISNFDVAIISFSIKNAFQAMPGIL